jgi:hypothetical protein
MSTYAPDFVTVPGQKDHLGNGVTLVNAAIYGRGFIPQPFRAAGITSPIVWGTFSLPDGYVSQVYFTEWFIENVDQPVDYTLKTGSLPPGLSLSDVGSPVTAEGSITGTPSTAGTYNFTLTATGPTATADQAFTIIIHTATSSGSSFVGGL